METHEQSLSALWLFHLEQSVARNRHIEHREILVCGRVQTIDHRSNYFHDKSLLHIIASFFESLFEKLHITRLGQVIFVEVRKNRPASIFIQETFKRQILN